MDDDNHSHWKGILDKRELGPGSSTRWWENMFRMDLRNGGREAMRRAT